MMVPLHLRWIFIFRRKSSLIPEYSIGPTLQDDGRSNQAARQIHPVS
jgi:hypothetical protein